MVYLVSPPYSSKVPFWKPLEDIEAVAVAREWRSLGKDSQPHSGALAKVKWGRVIWSLCYLVVETKSASGRSWRAMAPDCKGPTKSTRVGMHYFQTLLRKPVNYNTFGCLDGSFPTAVDGFFGLSVVSCRSVVCCPSVVKRRRILW